MKKVYVKYKDEDKINEVDILKEMAHKYMTEYDKIILGLIKEKKCEY